MSRRDRRVCQSCGASMTFKERRQNKTNGHHHSVFECPECGKERLRG